LIDIKLVKSNYSGPCVQRICTAIHVYVCNACLHKVF